MPFVSWRNKTGTKVRVTKFSEIGNASDPNVIKNYIAQVYHTWQNPPTHILLVGDYGQVPVSYANGVVNEDFFVEIDGNDFFPEMMIGRFTHDNDAGEQVIVNKIVEYERSPYTANTAWFKKGAVVSNNAYVSQAITKRYTRDRMLVEGGFTAVDTFINRSPCSSSLTDLMNVLNSGRSFLNYRGEGWYTEWWASCYRMSVTNVSSLNNGRMLTFVTSIGCGVANFTNSSGNSFGETWFELGTVAAPRGAVAFIGPTGNTHTAYNNSIDIGIYKGMFQEGMDTPGQALARGRLYMYEVFGNEYYVQYHTRIYCIIGDPSMHVWKNVPRPVTVVHPSSVPVGYNQVVITVTDSATGAPVAEAQVCLAGDSVYATAYADLHGMALVPITPQVIDTLAVLVRGGNVVPYESSVRITIETEHVAPFGAPVVVDLDGNLDGKINPNEHGQITFTLRNWGTQTASNVQAVLSVDTNLVRLQTTTPVSFGSLASGGSFTGSPFLFFLKPNAEVGDTIVFSLHVTSSTRSWDYIQLEDVRGCKLKSVMYVVDDRGSVRTNGRMDPNETVKLYLMVKNAGDDVAPNVQATLRCTSPYITISDSLSAFGTMRADTSFINYSDYFVVKVDSQCPAQSTIPYRLVLQTQGGRYAYSSVDTFSIPVSVPRHSDPTGPDTYGYFAYVNDDTLFQQSPRYTWFELNGLGTQVTGTGSDFTMTVGLPFTFRYYGVAYGQVRLSSDGWIALGNGTQTMSMNYPLPRNDAINCMVAAFWDDLFASSGETGKLLYYSDIPRHRFIIEWYNVGHRSDASKKETFQIILHDPSSYPTPTGDGEILMLYKD
ncbi:MAG: C25 family cysteine peptidase, partial [Bacteroidota bacterium]